MYEGPLPIIFNTGYFNTMPCLIAKLVYVKEKYNKKEKYIKILSFNFQSQIFLTLSIH